MHNKVIIIGAGRSGTNMLRDVLVNLPGFATWPCDEINAIWMHGNVSKATDVLTKEDLNTRTQIYIRSAFKKIWSDSDAAYVVEKTCANSLRVGFIAEVLPEAKFIHILRDGMDVVASSRKRWRGEFELPYFSYYVKKARYVPLVDIPRYLFRYLKTRVSLLFSDDGHARRWGPWTKELHEMVNSNSTIEDICAVQWSQCVESIESEFQHLDESRHMTIRYESLVSDSRNTIEKVFTFLGASVDDAELSESLKSLSKTSVGKGKQQLEDENIDLSRIVKLNGALNE